MQRVYNLDLTVWVIFKLYRVRDRFLQFLIVNEEFLVNASHQLALITSLPFVHTARRTYRLNDSVKISDRDHVLFIERKVSGSCLNLII